MQKHVNLVDLVKSFPTNIFLQNLASIQKRTSPMKFAHLSEKSENGSISNLSTKVDRDGRFARRGPLSAFRWANRFLDEGSRHYLFLPADRDGCFALRGLLSDLRWATVIS